MSNAQEPQSLHVALGTVINVISWLFGEKQKLYKLLFVFQKFIKADLCVCVCFVVVSEMDS